MPTEPAAVAEPDAPARVVRPAVAAETGGASSSGRGPTVTVAGGKGSWRPQRGGDSAGGASSSGPVWVGEPAAAGVNPGLQRYIDVMESELRQVEAMNLAHVGSGKGSPSTPPGGPPKGKGKGKAWGGARSVPMVQGKGKGKPAAPAAGKGYGQGWHNWTNYPVTENTPLTTSDANNAIEIGPITLCLQPLLPGMLPMRDAIAAGKILRGGPPARLYGIHGGAQVKRSWLCMPRNP